MKFADKIILLRKKHNFTQEELAEKMSVTRQSVSKWEGAQSVPDIEKTIKLSELFGVSTDYLLKDEIESYQTEVVFEPASNYKNVSLDEAESFLSEVKNRAKYFALGVFILIISPIALINLSVIGELEEYSQYSDAFNFIGFTILIVIAAISIGILMFHSSKLEKFKYLENEPLKIEDFLLKTVQDKRNTYKSIFTRNNIIGVSLCILSIIPILIGSIIDDDNDLLLMNLLSLTIVIVGIGVFILVKTGYVYASFQIILQEDDYTKEKKKNMPIFINVSVIYWSIVTAIYIGYSLYTNHWQSSWIIWVVAGILFLALISILNIVIKRDKYR